MMRKLYPIAALFVGLLFLTLFVVQANAAMTIYGLQQRLSEYGIPVTDPSEKYDRFYSGSDRDFIGDGYDWSGVGVVWAESYNSSTCLYEYRTRWVTMISPTYFLTAYHATPKEGEAVMFYNDEGVALGDPNEYFVEENIVSRIGDLCIGKLNKPIDEEDNIAYYPILDIPTNSLHSYNNLPFYSVGRGQIHPNSSEVPVDDPMAAGFFNPRVARNRIDKIENYGGPLEKIMRYDYDAYGDDDPERITSKGLGDDECMLVAGDSGATSFAVCNGELALIGIHWFIDGNDSADSFVPNCISSIKAYLAIDGSDEHEEVTSPTLVPGDANMDGIVNDVDLAIWATNEGVNGTVGYQTVGWIQGDFDGDRLVSILDRNIIAENWLKTPDTYIAPTAVPEPAVVWLVLSGLVSVIALRRWRVR